jgi:hypothetical protein
MNTSRFKDPQEKKEAIESYKICLEDLKESKFKFTHLRRVFLILLGIFVFQSMNGYNLYSLVFIGAISIVVFFFAKREYKRLCTIEVDKWWYEASNKETDDLIMGIVYPEKFEGSKSIIRVPTFVEEIRKFLTI